MARYYLETYGCTSNRGESRRIEAALRDAGHYRVDQLSDADVAILNTCTVIETTETKMLDRAASLASETTDLIITGCMALAQADTFEQEGIRARICHWDEVPSAVTNGECPTATPSVEPVLDGVVGILPIARGCLSDCSYCITKHATGKIDSPPIADNVAHARALIEAGAAEIRVTGQDTGVYGWDRNSRDLPELLEQICSIDGDFRVRLGMANPKGVHGILDELVDVFATEEKLYNFLHIPVQSGSNEVLAHMRRQHTVREFREAVDAFDSTLDDWVLSTDFIVGYPTETDTDHAKSVALLREMHPEKVNITRFSKRPGTDAAALHGLNGTIKKERSRELSAVKRDIVQAAYADLVGQTRDVLVVEPGRGDSLKCRDNAYRQIIIKGEHAAGFSPGDRTTVEITESQPMYAFGTPVAPSMRI